MRRPIFFALVLIAGCYNPKFKDQIACGTNGECPPGRMCGADLICHAGSPEDAASHDGAIDAALHDAANDAMPDAPPVACTSNVDCQNPPDACSVNGVCDPTQHVCMFQRRDCSALTDECNTGTCNTQTGCVKTPANQ